MRTFPIPFLRRLQGAGLIVAGLAFSAIGSSAHAQPINPMPHHSEAATAPQLKPIQQGKGVSFTGTEHVEADVSTHSIAVTSGFSGTKIIIFGAVNSTQQQKPEPVSYDVIVAVEGKPEPLVARKKSNVLGLWINLASMSFDRAPSYYTLASTRPIKDIANDAILARNRIGFDHLDMRVNAFSLATHTRKEIRDYKNAVVRLKRDAKLYQVQDYGVRFIGDSLFRSSFSLPANVPVGPLKANIFLFQHGKLVAWYTSQVELRRGGLQRILYNLAFNYPFWYGLMAVIFAAAAGLSASAVLGRKRH